MVTETYGLQPKIFTNWPFIEKLCQPLVQRKEISKRIMDEAKDLDACHTILIV